MLAKSCKTIPVMLAGVLLHGKRYKPLEYISALLIAGATARTATLVYAADPLAFASPRWPRVLAGGISLFAIVKDSDHVRSKLMTPNPGLGYALVFINLGLDGYTNAQQDQARGGSGTATRTHKQRTVLSQLSQSPVVCSRPTRPRA